MGQAHRRPADDLFTDDDTTSARHRATDWAATSLGPVGSWPAELRAAIRTIMPSRVPMMLWCGPDLVQICNHACAAVLGAKYPAAVGQPAAECWAEVWDELGPLADQVIRDGRAVRAENQLLHLRRHGYLEETYWTFSFSPVHAGIFVVTSDVTEQVIGTRRLETLRRLGLLSTADVDTPAGVCRAAVAVLARNAADLPVVQVYVRAENANLTLVAASGEPVDLLDVVHRVADTGQADRFANSIVSPLFADSAVAGVLVVGLSRHREFDDDYADFVDLVITKVASLLSDAIAYTTERARAQTLAELDEARTLFFQNISHEFRTPLTLLLGPLDTLSARGPEMPPTDQQDLLTTAYRAAQRLHRLVDDLVDVATAQTDQLHTNPEPTDVAALTTECADMFRSAADRAGIELVITTQPVAAALDQEMWARIVLNLVSNAVKFTPDGTVTVDLDCVDGQVVLTVADTGRGIPAAEQDRVFDRFRRVEHATGRTREGAGIGLALVADLADALGGDVGLSSEPGKGSTFTVTVPYVPAGTPPAVNRPRLQQLGVAFIDETRPWEPPSPQPAATTATRQILLADHDADMRDYLTRLLTKQQWAVVAVADADTALTRAQAERPDLVLTDGLPLLRALRADPSLARLPVVLLTARAGAESAVEGLRFGADDYVVKPFHPVELIARIRVHLEMSRFRETLIAQSAEQTANLQIALSTRGMIGQAVGIVMATQRCDADTAYQRLVTMSQHQNTKLRDIAEHLVRQFTALLSAESP